MKFPLKSFGSVLFASSLILSTQILSAEEIIDMEVKAFYGDNQGVNGEGSRTVAIDVNTMSVLISNPSEAGINAGAYSVNQAGETTKLYVDTRNTNSMEILDSVTNEAIGTIPMVHYPRSSEAYNPRLGLQLVTGKNKPMASLIDVETDSVVAIVGENIVYPANGDYGGGNATGHPFWFSKHKFALIDRPNRKIDVYKVKKRHGQWTVKKLSSIATSTTIHHFLNAGKKRQFFAVAEGSAANNYSPKIIKYRLRPNGKLVEKESVNLSNIAIENMGAHHADLHPDSTHLYIGSTEGTMYVINIDDMNVVTTIPVGQGAGHTAFIEDRGLAVVTNHKDTFVSIIDITNHTLIKNVTVSGPQENGTILQSHTSMVHPNMDYFYAFATDNGVFYELDLETLEVSRTLATGGTPLQGVFMCDGQACSDMMM